MVSVLHLDRSRWFLSYVWTGLDVVLEPPITPVPPRGNFQGYDFLKNNEKCYKMSVVCTLAVGDLRRFWVK
jgi:hypothetical protein